MSEDPEPVVSGKGVLGGYSPLRRLAIMWLLWGHLLQLVSIASGLLESMPAVIALEVLGMLFYLIAVFLLVLSWVFPGYKDRVALVYSYVAFCYAAGACIFIGLFLHASIPLAYMITPAYSTTLIVISGLCALASPSAILIDLHPPNFSQLSFKGRYTFNKEKSAPVTVKSVSVVNSDAPNHGIVTIKNSGREEVRQSNVTMTSYSEDRDVRPKTTAASGERYSDPDSGYLNSDPAIIHTSNDPRRYSFVADDAAMF